MMRRIPSLGVLALLLPLAACGGGSDSTTTGTAGGTGGTGGSTVGGVTRAGLPGSQEDLVANVGDRIFFDLDRSSVSGTGPRAVNNTTTLDRQIAWLQQYPRNNILVAGNCDERGTNEYNVVLGARRAAADRDYLVGKGVAAARIATISYGKERPVAMGSNEDAWSQNRNAITSVK